MDWHDIENNVASEVHLKRFNSKEVRLKCRKHSCFSAQMVPCNKKVTHNVKLHAIRESRDSTLGKYSLLWTRQGSDPFQSARDNSLQEEGGISDSSEADRDAMEAGVATTSCPENNCMYRKSHHSQFLKKTL